MFRSILASAIGLLLFPVTAGAEMITVSWSAQLAGGGFGDSAGRELRAGSLVRLGYFDLDDAEVLERGLDFDHLEKHFVELSREWIGTFGRAVTEGIGETAPGVDLGVAAAFAQSFSFDPSRFGGGVEGRRFFIWAVDVPSLTVARPRGHALVSDATWQFPSQAMGTFTWDVSEVSPVEEGDIHVAEKGKAGSESTTVGGPLNFMVRLPLTGDHADDDLDGVPALLELAFGMDALSADRSLLPQAILLSDGDSRFVGVSFRRAVGGTLDPATLQYTAAGLRYTVQASDDLIAWSDLGAEEAQISQATALGDGYESVIVALATPVGEEGSSTDQAGRSRFLRVHVERMTAP